MFGGINFNGMQIDPQQMQQMQENAKTCAEHPECVGCPLYTINGYNNTICENAIIKLSQNNNAQSEQTSS